LTRVVAVSDGRYTSAPSHSEASSETFFFPLSLSFESYENVSFGE